VLREVVPADRWPGLVPPWYRSLAGTSTHAGQPDAAGALADPDEPLPYVAPDDALRETTPRELLVALVERPLDPGIMCVLQAFGTTVVERLLLRPAQVPPDGAIRLLHELVIQPEPSRWRLLTAVRELTGLPDAEPAPASELLAYVEFDLLDPEHPGTETSSLVVRLSALSEAIRRAEGWLAGAQITHGRVGDAFAVTVRQPNTAPAAWRAVLRFAREVHHTCRAASIDLRTGVCVGTGVAFPEVYGRFGAAGGLQKAVHVTLAQAPAFQRSAVPRRDGLAIVVTHVGDEGLARAHCERLWAEVDEPGVTPVAFGALPSAGAGVFYDLRRL
jgi:hypothetical protein